MSATDPSATQDTTGTLGVLVGVDGSEQSISAARWAQRAAHMRGLPFTLATAYTAPTFWGYTDLGAQLADDSALREGVTAMLDSVVAKLDPALPQPTLRAELGDAAGVLVELSRDAELLVSGARGRGGFLGRLLGSVSSALPGHAHCPTVIIPAGEDGSRAADDAPVVVGIDGSDQGRLAALTAAREAQLRGAPLELVSALQPISASTAWLSVAVDENAIEEDMRARMEEGAQWLRDHFPGLQIDLTIVHGQPIEIMTERTRTARLTVVGTRGLGGFTGALLGSTSQGIAVHAKGPLMVVPFAEDARLANRAKYGPMPGEQA